MPNTVGTSHVRSSSSSSTRSSSCDRSPAHIASPSPPQRPASPPPSPISPTAYYSTSNRGSGRQENARHAPYSEERFSTLDNPRRRRPPQAPPIIALETPPVPKKRSVIESLLAIFESKSRHRSRSNGTIGPAQIVSPKPSPAPLRKPHTGNLERRLSVEETSGAVTMNRREYSRTCSLPRPLTSEFKRAERSRHSVHSKGQCHIYIYI